MAKHLLPAADGAFAWAMWSPVMTSRHHAAWGVFHGWAEMTPRCACQPRLAYAAAELAGRTGGAVLETSESVDPPD